MTIEAIAVDIDGTITEDCTLYAQWGDPVTSISLTLSTAGSLLKKSKKLSACPQ